MAGKSLAAFSAGTMLVFIASFSWGQREIPVSKIIENVVANERIYKDIEVVWRRSYRIESPKVIWV
jgi:hypothetical protein